MDTLSAPPAAAVSRRGVPGDTLGWWRNGAIHPEVGEKLPPNSAGWYLLEARP